jgi:anthranilate/para-aminobenzoate synthase component I
VPLLHLGEARVQIIHELEATPREIYTGAVGYRSPVAGLELNVAIRTFELFHKFNEPPLMLIWLLT